jgi:NADPH-dependent 2,4-dienoyl-CoA reductase/sulfur reductase-like enzyme
VAPRRIVIVGASLAGIRAAETLRREGHDGPLTLIGAEALMPYDRPPLSKQVLAGTMVPEATDLRFDPDLGAEFMLSTRATGLDLEQRRVAVQGEYGTDTVPYDALVIATGAHPRTLPGLPDLEGVFLLRTRDDCLRLRAALAARPRVVVVGAGFIGSEVAATCHGLGLNVTVVEALPVPMVRAIGEQMGQRCTRLHLDHGVNLRLGTGVAGLTGGGQGSQRVEGVRLDDGTVIPADVVVVGVGVAPTTEWLAGSGVDLDNGVRCDQWCRVLADGHPLPNVVAAGDVASWDYPTAGRPVRVEHWTNAIDQGQAAASTLLRGEEAAPYDPVPYFWSDQYETKIQFVGHVRADDELHHLEDSPDDERFVVGWSRDGRLVGALGFGRPARVVRYRAQILAGAPWPPQTPPHTTQQPARDGTPA